jgi:hypothetical protein
MARHARPRIHRRTRNAAIAVVTAGAAALTVAALRAPSPFTSTASATSAGSARTATDGGGHTGSASANAAVASMARQSAFALQRAHDHTRHQQEEARHQQQRSTKPAARKPATHHATAQPTRRPAPAPTQAHTTTAPRPAATPATSAAPTPTVSATPTPSASPTATTTYANNLDGWIKQALAIMAQHGIPGTYDGIHRNIMRESSGDPNAVNNWDSNAAKGTPSKGLLQVIQPTFDAYHVAGTSNNIMDPVANIVAACNYAAAMYGSIDNVYSAY